MEAIYFTYWLPVHSLVASILTSLLTQRNDHKNLIQIWSKSSNLITFYLPNDVWSLNSRFPQRKFGNLVVLIWNSWFHRHPLAISIVSILREIIFVAFVSLDGNLLPCSLPPLLALVYKLEFPIINILIDFITEGPSEVN